MLVLVRFPAALRWIFRVAGKWKRGVVCLLLTQSALALLGAGSAWLYRGMVNAAVARSVDGFTRYAFLLALTQILLLGLRAAFRFLREDTESGVENALKGRLFSTLLSRDFAAVTATHSGEWMNRLTSDAAVTAKGVAEILPDAAGMLCQILGAAVLLGILIPGLAWVLPPAGVLLLALTFRFRRGLKELHRAQQEADGKVRVHFQESLSAMPVLRAFSRESAVLREADQRMDAHRMARLRRNRFANLCGAGLGAVMNGAKVAGGVYCGWRILRGEMSYGSLVAVMQLLGQVQSPLANISGCLPRYYAMIASAERLMEAEAWEVDASGPQKTDTEIRRFYRDSFAALAFRHVGFRYRPDTPVLRDVNFRIQKGEFVALTGVSGSGKSSLLKLLLCLYAPDSGERVLLLSGDKMSPASPDHAAPPNLPPVSNAEAIPLDASWRRLFAYVPQGNQLMAGSIREAVAFGDPDGTRRDGEIWDALEAACAAEFVRGRPEGLEARLGERGAGWSEGQLQRLAIARAVFSGRPVLLLDEATGALDEESEARLLRNLRRMTECSVLIVTHRPAALAVCDREIRLCDGGQIREVSPPRNDRDSAPRDAPNKTEKG